MIQVKHNSEGSGDWVQVWNGEELLFEGDRITPFDLVDLLNWLNPAAEAELVRVNDEAFE